MSQKERLSSVIVINDPGGGIEFMHIHTDDVCFCLRASMGASKAPIVAIYDARGNGGGDISPTITGDHNAHISDYTAIVVERKDEGKTMLSGNGTWMVEQKPGSADDSDQCRGGGLIANLVLEKQHELSESDRDAESGSASRKL